MKPGNMEGLPEPAEKEMMPFQDGKKPLGSCQISLASAVRSCVLGRQDAVGVSSAIPTPY